MNPGLLLALPWGEEGHSHPPGLLFIPTAHVLQKMRLEVR